MSHYIGFDLGGTNLRAAIADTDTGQIFHQRKRPTLANEGQEAVARSERGEESCGSQSVEA